MGVRRLQDCEHGTKAVVFSSSGIKIRWGANESSSHATRFFASVGRLGMGIGVSPNTQNPQLNGPKLLTTNSYMRYVTIPESGYRVGWVPELMEEKAEEVGRVVERSKMGGLKLKIKIGNPSLRRLISGAIAGTVSRSAVAPLETMKTHLMVGSCGNSITEVFQSIMESEGWKGLFRGNLVNVIRVAPSKAIELFAYDTVKNHLTPKPGEDRKPPIPASSIAGAVAGFSSTLCTYPLELLKNRLTIQRGVYKNLLDAFFKIVTEEGPAELYRGLTPSLIGVIPYAATSYFAYDTLRKAYKKASDREEIGNITTLLMGSAAAAISSSATFPLEVARRQMQAGAFNGRQYNNLLHALISILEREGIPGLYRGLGPSYLKLVPAAGISFMCYEACKKILTHKEEEF
ncbi:adenine nucleotide transporter BT1, chloroplastic/mitochondrial [Ziziphus jujuba]|uniref:Adenine nucleotide transporter BT1, chloroplastic/mitochondrial n=1 Tax=Ziziphus jujuba TaxID=326968 RepID=A0A6P3ZUJ9_ZIZJJ|nr:adenine nucleotide transporter BT1, chloroplastic/mitochondrial [Ziziphus jujuba]